MSQTIFIPVLIEVPPLTSGLRRAYALDAMRDSIAKHEAPLNAQILYTGVLDGSTSQRQLAFAVNDLLRPLCRSLIVYSDLGIDSAMEWGMVCARKARKPIFMRQLQHWRGVEDR